VVQSVKFQQHKNPCTDGGKGFRQEHRVILTITPNAAVDKTYCIEGFALNRVNRPSQSFTVAGGKGINAARVYQTLGGKALAAGFLGGLNGGVIARSLETEGILSQFVQVGGESRVCIAIIDPTTGTQTEINESGPTISCRNTQDLVASVSSLLSLESFEFIVLCGSLPPGAPDSLYADLISLARTYKVPSVLDASGIALRLGLEARPWMIKPNLSELEGLASKSLSDRNAQIGAVNELHAQGVEIVVLTLGHHGAIGSAGLPNLVESIMWEATPPTIRFASAVASGDSFLAAFLWSWGGTGKSDENSTASRLEAALRLGTGAGAANAAEIGAGFCSRDSIFAAAAGAHTRRISAMPS
jgi:1-phosphofructokinase family hexose kinase